MVNTLPASVAVTIILVKKTELSGLYLIIKRKDIEFLSVTYFNTRDLSSFMNESTIEYTLFHSLHSA